MRARLQIFLPAALIAGVSLWIYWPALRGDWVWDDTMYLTENPVLRSPTAWREIWTGQSGFNFFPITETVQWLQWRCWGPNPLGYHLTNLALHVLSALLFWRLLAKLFAGNGRPFPAAWLGGLLFAAHPVAVESVAWVSELKNTLSLPFLLLAMLAWLRFEGRVVAPYLGALACFLAALLCKSTVVMLPVLLLGHALWRRGRIRGADFAASLPFFALSLGFGLFSVWFEHHEVVDYLAVPKEALATRFAAAGLALVFYLGKCLFPIHLAAIYPRWPLPTLSAFLFLPWLALGALGGWVAWAAARGRPAGRAALLGLGWFALNAAPILGLVGMAYLRISRVADHFAYLPLLGVAGLGAGALGAAIRRRRAAGWCCAALVAGALAVASRSAAENFRGETAFWTAALQRNPQAWMAHYNLGNQLRREERLPEAIAHYREAVRLQPTVAEPWSNLGVCLTMTGRSREAVPCLETAVRLAPDSPENHNNLAIALTRVGRSTEAVSVYRRAVSLRPDFFEARYNLALALVALSRSAEAVPEYEAAARLRPGFPPVERGLAYALQAAGRFDEARAHLHAAERLEAANPRR